MKEYNAVFCYSIIVEAEDEESAQDTAWLVFGNSSPVFSKDFACVVEEMD
jgi:hypothetical protein